MPCSSSCWQVEDKPSQSQSWIPFADKRDHDGVVRDLSQTEVEATTANQGEAGVSRCKAGALQHVQLPRGLRALTTPASTAVRMPKSKSKCFRRKLALKKIRFFTLRPSTVAYGSQGQLETSHCLHNKGGRWSCVQRTSSSVDTWPRAPCTPGLGDFRQRSQLLLPSLLRDRRHSPTLLPVRDVL